MIHRKSWILEFFYIGVQVRSWFFFRSQIFEDTDATTSEATVVVRMTILEPLEEINARMTVTVDEAVKKIAEVVNDGNFAVPFEFDVSRINTES